MMKRMKGFTLIELLIVVAIIAILAAIAVPNFLEAQTRSKVSRVRADQRSLATAIEAYYVDNNNYPAQDSALSPTATANTSADNLPNVAATAPIRSTQTFKMRGGAGANSFATLTTPISYITSLFPDPFADSKGVTFRYSRSADAFGSGWLIWSFGPDTDEASCSTSIAGDIPMVNRFVDLTTYNPNQTVPSVVLTDRTYDPTNGTTSNGDVWRVKQ